jgi:tyrosinase
MSGSDSATSSSLDKLLSRRSFLGLAGGALAASALPLRGLATSEASSSGRSGPLLVRRNITRLSAAEKDDLVKSILAMKAARSPYDPSVNYYDQFVRWHRMSLTCPTKDYPGTPWPAHAGPGFLPWHRLLVALFERGLSEVSGKRMALPYWNWTEPESIDVVFAENFMGPRTGDSAEHYVMTKGPFRKGAFDLKVHSALSDDPGQSVHLVRAFGVSANDFYKAIAPALPTGQELAYAMTLEDYDAAPFDISADPNRSFRGRLEGWSGFKSIACSVDGVEEPIPGPSPSLMLHNRVHYFVAGSYKVGDQVWFGSFKPHSSPNDPVFFMHHAFVDKVWADWMARHGRRYVPDDLIPRPVGAVVDVPGKDTPIKPFVRIVQSHSTPASILDHRSLGYMYDTDRATT